MGNKLTCCLKPSANPKLGRHSRRVEPRCEPEVYEAAARDAVAAGTSPASPKPPKWNFGGFKGLHPENTRGPETPEVQDKKKNNDVIHGFPGRLTKKYRSCPTVFLDDSTVSQPNFRTTIQCVTLAIHERIKNRVGNRSYDIFDERTHPFAQELITRDHFMLDPELKIIYRFVCTLFSAEHLTAECAIVTLVYLERLLTYTNTDICPTNWKRILLGAAILAYEFWDNQALWDVDYCQLIDNIITVKDMNEIEMYFLHLIHFNINIPASMYARYYFDLRSLAHENNLLVLFEPLCKERAQNTEAISRCCKEKDLCRATIERSLSAENFIGMQWTKAMLS
ncbi:PREDICTED: cyclin-Y-like protein 1 [Miniopterus natalensis]|uniref:cyclin-Y-like protein 1 n=1 Tax=Miniopterus natalensis TaxID=291302 RepID=UPI0007A6DD3A|nr:PREDICTED: cyclin-Y-like protein 1 [Miniopterus natalensis]